MIMFAFPRSIDEPQWLNITAYNKCEFPINLVRLWINDTAIPISTTIPAMGSANVTSYEINAINGSKYQVTATSDRGNIYASEAGTLYFNGGEWETETVGIHLVFPSRPGKKSRVNDWKNQLKITITENEVGGDTIYDEIEMYWAVSASEKFFELGAPGTYNVTVWSKQDNPDPFNGVIYGPARAEKGVGCDPITIDWPEGPAIPDINFVIVNVPLADAHLEIED